jgi:pimeloyl-ACP methyl ester carboxylesterase
MNFRTRTRRLIPFCGAAVVAGAAVAAMLLATAPASARVFVGIGVGWPGFYYPAPYPVYPYPPPYYYPPPPPYYYPPPPTSAPSATNQPRGGPPAVPSFSYTNRPEWKNAAGQPCREYKSTQMVGGRQTEVYGTACRDPGGAWRVVN